MADELTLLVENVAAAMCRHGLMLATAESCTGGWVAQALTSVSGSSRWFERGFVTYSNRSKQEMLGVSAGTLARYGAVSEQTVREMAEGALQHSHAQVSVAISGIAGPGGGVLDKPVGTVCLAWAAVATATRSQTLHLSGDRQQVRYQAVAAALQGVAALLADWS